MLTWGYVWPQCSVAQTSLSLFAEKRDLLGEIINILNTSLKSLSETCRFFGSGIEAKIFLNLKQKNIKILIIFLFQTSLKKSNLSKIYQKNIKFLTFLSTLVTFLSQKRFLVHLRWSMVIGLSLLYLS